MNMYLHDLQLNRLVTEQVKQDILNGLGNLSIPSQAEVETALSEMYVQSNAAVCNGIGANTINFASNVESAFAIPFVGGNFWGRLKHYLCEFLHIGSTESDIIDKILEWITDWMPGGVFIGYLVKKVVRYVLNMGYENLCPI